MRRFFRFAFTGAVGFLVDAALLALLVRLTPLGPFLARIVSVTVALAVTWVVNRHFTFGPSGRPAAIEGARYGGVGLASSLLNYVIYSLALLAVPGLPPLAALVIASAAALAFSFLGYSRLVFDR